MAPRWASSTATASLQDGVEAGLLPSRCGRGDGRPAAAPAAARRRGRAACCRRPGPDGLVPGRFGRALDAHAVGRRRRVGRPRLSSMASTTTATSPNWSRSLAPQRPLAVAEPDAVEAGAVGAAQVAHAPAAVGGPHLGVVAADGTVVQHDLQADRAGRSRSSSVRFPGLALDRARSVRAGGWSVSRCPSPARRSRQLAPRPVNAGGPSAAIQL